MIQKSRSILYEGSRSLGMFRKGKRCIIATFHRTDFFICSHSRETETPSYSWINTVSYPTWPLTPISSGHQHIQFNQSCRYRDYILKYFSYSSIKTAITLKCLSIGTPNIINFPFVSNGKLIIFRRPNIQTDYNEAVLCLNFGTPENNEFSIWDKWKIYYF